MKKLFFIIALAATMLPTQLFADEGMWLLQLMRSQNLEDKMKELGLEINEENERKTREMLRASGDKGIYAKIFLPEIEKEIKKGNVVIESLYSWSEYKIIKEKFGDIFEVLCIATNAPLRRERLKNRGFRPMDYETSKSRDYSEIENIEKGGPIGIADHYILNNGTVQTLKRNVKKYIQSLEK